MGARIAFFILYFSVQVAALPLLPTDHKPFQYPQPERLVAFGDIHGDYSALATILTKMHLIDANTNWIGGQTMLIGMGDLLDRGPNSRQVMELLMKLEDQASQAGGHVIVLIGNHEGLVTEGQYHYFSLLDARNYRDFGPDSNAALAAAFSGQSPFAKWIASRPAAVVVGEPGKAKLFVHAGVEQWIGDVKLDELNATVRAWLLFEQGNGPKPPDETRWVIEQEGPLWTRKLSDHRVRHAILRTWLDRAGLAQVVVGHTVTESRKPEIHGQLAMIDTAISIALGGRLSAVEWKKGHDLEAMLFNRPFPTPTPANSNPAKEISEDPCAQIFFEGDLP